MSPDEYQQAWQSRAARPRITIDAELLLKEVHRSQRNFLAMILMRDIWEVGVSVLLIPAWFYLGIRLSSVWTWYLEVPALVWVAGFIVVDRRRHPQRPPGPGEPLLHSVNESLRQVEHQIWLLRNVLWWYLLPLAVPLTIFLVHTASVTSNSWLAASVFAAMSLAFLIGLYGFIYYLNLAAVPKELEPRRQELLALRDSLSDETAGEGLGEYPTLTPSSGISCSPRRMIIAAICFVAILAIGVPAILSVAVRMASGPEETYAKKSPFAAVRWEDSQPEVQVGGEWFKLLSLDGIPASEIVAQSEDMFGDLWRKRFEEDLVELLTRMGHPPGDSVTLVVESLETAEERTLEGVPLTSANRQAIRDAAQARQNSAQMTLAELAADLRRERDLVGLAAMVMADGQVVDSAADGERKKGSQTPVTTGDRWHLGSITKSITATMIARLVESGRMEWSGAIGDYFPADSIHEDWKAVTVRQLLTHTAGAPANFSAWVSRRRPALGPESTEARREAALKVLAKEPEHPPGSSFVYSNVGYAIAAAMAEQAAGETWDTLVTREVFEPLALKGAGFGPPKSSNKTLEQPRGHRRILGRKLAMDDEADNTAIIAPAGMAHMTLEDLCAYAAEHLRGHRGEGALLSAETYALLHTPERDRYACGWVKKEPDAAIPHTVYWHNGSNTMWYALVVFIPGLNMVAAVTANDGDIQQAEAAAWEIVRAAANR